MAQSRKSAERLPLALQKKKGKANPQVKYSTRNSKAKEGLKGASADAQEGVKRARQCQGLTGKDKEEVQTEALTDDNDGADEVTYEVSKAMADEDVPKVNDNVLTMLSG